jgi:hypothetical protein
MTSWYKYSAVASTRKPSCIPSHSCSKARADDVGGDEVTDDRSGNHCRKGILVGDLGLLGLKEPVVDMDDETEESKTAQAFAMFSNVACVRWLQKSGKIFSSFNRTNVKKGVVGCGGSDCIVGRRSSVSVPSPDEGHRRATTRGRRGEANRHLHEPSAMSSQYGAGFFVSPDIREYPDY